MSASDSQPEFDGGAHVLLTLRTTASGSFGKHRGYYLPSDGGGWISADNDAIVAVAPAPLEVPSLLGATILARVQDVLVTLVLVEIRPDGESQWRRLIGPRPINLPASISQKWIDEVLDVLQPGVSS